MARPPRQPSIRPSLVDAGWAHVPSVVPNDTIVGGSTESNELTAPVPPVRDSVTELTEPTGEIDQLLEGAFDSRLGFPPPPATPNFGAPPSQPSPPSHPPPAPSHRPPPPSHRPPPPSHRPPPPSHRPWPPSAGLPPSSHRTLQMDYPNPPAQPAASSRAFAPTQPLPAHSPPHLRGRVAPPRPQLPSDMPMQELRSDDGLPDLRTEESGVSELGLTPSSRLPAGIVIPDAAAPFAQCPAPADATQPATRLVSAGRVEVQATTVPSPVVPDLRARDSPPTLAQALRARVRVGPQVLALWLPVAAAVAASTLLFGAFTGLVTALASRSSAPVPHSPQASERAQPESAAPLLEPVPAPEATPPSGAHGRAAEGDEKALSELAGRAAKDRTIAESLAVHAGQMELQRRELARLGREAMQPGFANDKSNVKRLLGYVHDADTSRQALEIVARLPSIVGPDVLYQVWTGTNKRSPTTELAEALVLSKEVRARASPALAAALELRTADTCEQAKQALSRVAEHGDRRSLSWLAKLTKKAGCGDDKRSDCYPCLRDGDELKNAVKAVGKRRAPRY
jgi:hypothetical protein